MLHTIRHIINDDAKWLSILRGLNAHFWHQSVTTEQIESYISKKAGIDLSKVCWTTKKNSRKLSSIFGARAGNKRNVKVKSPA